MSRLFASSSALLGLVIVVGACGGASTAPSTDPPVGNYNAISFRTSGNSGQRDELLAGGSLQLELDSHHASSGHLHVAASSGNPVVDADMAGTWTASGKVVTVSQTADTFVRDMPLTLSFDPANGYVLSGTTIFSGQQIEVTLKRASCPTC